MRRDQLLAEHFLSTYNNCHGCSYKVVRWPDAINRKTEAVEAVARNESGETIALEHTLIEPFCGEREDTNRFMRVFGELEGNPDLKKLGCDVDVVVQVGAIKTGFEWEEAREFVHRYLASRIPLLKEGITCEEIAGAGFKLEVTLGITAHDPGMKDHVWISRTLPVDSLEVVVRRALEHKLPKLLAEPATRRILLFEKADIAIGLTNIRVALDSFSVDFPQLKKIDEVWLAITHCWESEDVLFFNELSPELGGRRWMMEKTSTFPVTVRKLGAAAN